MYSLFCEIVLFLVSIIFQLKTLYPECAAFLSLQKLYGRKKLLISKISPLGTKFMFFLAFIRSPKMKKNSSLAPWCFYHLGEGVVPKLGIHINHLIDKLENKGKSLI